MSNMMKRKLTLRRLFRCMFVLSAIQLPFVLFYVLRDVINANLHVWERIQLFNSKWCLVNVGLNEELILRTAIRDEIDRLYEKIISFDSARDSAGIVENTVEVIKEIGRTSVRKCKPKAGQHRSEKLISNKNVNIVICVVDIDVHQNDRTAKNMEILLQTASVQFKDYKIFLATDNKSLALRLQNSAIVQVNFVEQSSNIALIWNSLLRHVGDAHFVLLLKSLQTLSSSTPAALSSGVSLIRQSPDVELLSFPTLHDNVRYLNCYQLQLKDYHLSIKTALKIGQGGETFCHFSYGPLLVRTRYIKQFNFDVSLDDPEIVFLDLFVHAYIRNDRVLHCRECEAMANFKAGRLTSEKRIWISFLRKINLNSITVDGEEMVFSCEEAEVSCLRKYNRLGMRIPTCCLLKQSEQVITALEYCQQYDIPCELDAGTALAAVKLNQPMPWDLDVDVSYGASHIPIMNKTIIRHFIEDGQMMRFTQTEPLFVATYKDRRYPGLNLDLFSNKYKKNCLLHGSYKSGTFAPTKGNFSGYMANIPFNPGLYARQKYGQEVYKHSFHWASVGGIEDVYKGGSFKMCGIQRHHACLDLAMPDGNMNFGNVRSWYQNMNGED